MEEVEDLPIETIYNLIRNGILSLDEFKDWVYHRDSNEYDAGYLRGEYDAGYLKGHEY